MTPSDKPVAVGLLGLGSIGRRHASMIAREIPSLHLVAVHDRDESVAQRVGDEVGADVAPTSDSLLSRDDIEAVVIATPHSQHIVFAEPALQRGLHVLVEKPVAMSVEGAGRVNRAFEVGRRDRPELVFAAMFQQRCTPVWQRLREIVRDELGPIQRCNWTVTDWFRTQAYYDGGGWRGTWKYEGGGVLMNQAPHNLDLLLWITGLVPREVMAVTHYGRFHRVETEDEVAA
ncbi:MAG: Gfo/Idh/MocA family oxidoreductase, partial [Planctomycetota bacterium]